MNQDINLKVWFEAKMKLMLNRVCFEFEINKMEPFL